jgi:hypothetical protein
LQKPQSPNDKRICDSKKLFSAEFTGLWTQTSSLKAAMRRKLNFAVCEIGTVRRIPLRFCVLCRDSKPNTLAESGFCVCNAI